MLQDVYEMLLLRRLEPRFVGGEVHVDVRGHAFAVASHPDGLAICERPTKTPDEKIFAYVCDELDEAIAVLGL